MTQTMFEQDRFIVRLQQRLMGEKEIVAGWLSGSYGRKQADAYSDIDICLVYTDDKARAAAWESRRAFTHSILAYVPARSFDAGHVRPFFHVVIFSNGTKADFRFESQTQLEPNPWDGDIHILKDTDQWAARFQQASARLPFPQARTSGEALAALDEQFWVMFWDVYRQAQRGKPAKAFVEYIHLLAGVLPTVLKLLPAGDPAAHSLMELRYSLEADITRRHLHSLLAAYKQARQAIIQRQQLAYIPDTAFERQLERLLERLKT